MKSPLYQWLREQPLGIRDKAVLSKLCNYANDNTFEAGVRVADLAVEVGCCERTIQTTLRHLESIETISTTGRSKRLRSGGLVPLYQRVRFEGGLVLQDLKITVVKPSV